MRLKHKILAAAGLVMSLGVAAPAFAQQYYPQPDADHWEHHHHWHHGEHFHGNANVVYHWDHYRLPPPPYGFEWVRADHQFLLINASNGWIRDVVVW